MKSFIVISSLLVLCQCQTPLLKDCDYSQENVKAIYDRSEVFRNQFAFDPEDNTQKLTKFSEYTAHTGDLAAQIQIEGIYYSENYKKENGKYITQSGQIQLKDAVINFKRTTDGFEFENLNDKANSFTSTVQDFAAEIPQDVEHKDLLNQIHTWHNKLFLVKEKFNKESPHVSLYDLSPLANGFYLQYQESESGLSESVENSKVEGRFTCGQKEQKYTVVGGDLKLDGEPFVPVYH